MPDFQYICDMVPESVGKRIARLRQQRGWTQQTMADRAAISRVAVSHIETDLSLPSERTIALLAGLFKTTPLELVSGTTYPPGKADRLPTYVCWHTELELELALLRNDLDWLDRLPHDALRTELAGEVRAKWLPRLGKRFTAATDSHERSMVAAAHRALTEACS